MDRRSFCKSLGAGLLGAAALTAGTASAAEPTQPGTVTTRDHFDVKFGFDYLTDGNTPTNYGVEGTVPGREGAAPDELVVQIHGFNWTPSAAAGQFETVAESTGRAGSSAPVVGYSWDSDNERLEWWPTVDIAERNGAKLAAFLADYREAAPETTVRLIAHSLGAQVAFSAAERLADADVTDAVDSLSLLGAAVDDEAASLGAFDETYGHALQTAVGQVDNFYKTDDETLGGLYEFAEWDTALGRQGISGPAPDNYSERDVTYVESHGDYYRYDSGCIQAVVDSW